MAVTEGFRRIRFVGKAILGIGLILDAWLAMGYLIAAFGPREPIFGIGFSGIPLTVLGIAILLIAWIAEGFVVQGQRPHPSSQQHPQMLR